MKNIYSLLVLLLIFTPSFSQSLSERLWDRVDRCHSNFEDMDDDGELDFDKIDDSKNGYLMVSGGWPTCGCSCSSTVGAFKNSPGEYVFVQKETYLCSWEKKISSNRPLDEILPADFGITTFGVNKKYAATEYASFFLDVEIPQYGTETVVNLQLIPLGILVESKNPIVYAYSESKPDEEGGASQAVFLNKIKELVSDLKSDKTLQLLLEKDFEQITEEDRKRIDKIVGTGNWDDFESIDELSDRLKLLKRTYDIWNSLEYRSLILGWDKAESRFYIKKKVGSSGKMSFKQFLIESEYWLPMC